MSHKFAFPVAGCHEVVIKKGALERVKEDYTFSIADISRPIFKRFRHGDIIFVKGLSGYRNLFVKIVKKDDNGKYEICDLNDTVDDYGSLPAWTSVIDHGFSPYYYGVESSKKNVSIAYGLIDHNCIIPFCTIRGHRDVFDAIKSMLVNEKPWIIIEKDNKRFGIVNNDTECESTFPYFDDEMIYLCRFSACEFFEGDVSLEQIMRKGCVLSEEDVNMDFKSLSAVIALRNEGIEYTHILKVRDY